VIFNLKSVTDSKTPYYIQKYYQPRSPLSSLGFFVDFLSSTSERPEKYVKIDRDHFHILKNSKLILHHWTLHNLVSQKKKKSNIKYGHVYQEQISKFYYEVNHNLGTEWSLIFHILSTRNKLIKV